MFHVQTFYHGNVRNAIIRQGLKGKESIMPGIINEHPIKTEIEYLACPYSHPDPKVMVRRFELANKVAGKLMLQGRVIFSPISHSHPIQQHLDPSYNTYDFWLKQDNSFLDIAKRLIVLMLPGWKDSKGVQAEIARAAEHGIPIEFIFPTPRKPKKKSWW